jgi:lactate dehydrogenase-like 2-hydroxyacid dehydrogenase
MEVRYHNRQPVPDAGYRHEPSLLELAAWADFLVVSAAAGPEADGLVGAEVLRALGPSGYLVNIARGSLVDEAALVTALQQGTIAGAGLDVYADEPRVPAALRALDNVVLMPHAASATHETRRDMVALVLRNLAQFYAVGRVAQAVPGTQD